jgi:type I restriction enzyme, R subunit
MEGALQSLKDEMPVLRDRHLRVVDLFRQRGIDLEDTEACVEALGRRAAAGRVRGQAQGVLGHAGRGAAAA